MSEKQRLPFAVFDATLSGLQSAMRTVTGVAAAPFRRGEASAPGGGAPATEATSDERMTGSDLTLQADTATAPNALATALDERGRDALAAHADETATSSAGSVIDRIPRADAHQREGGHSDHEQPAPDETLGPRPFTPQVGP